MDFEEKTLELQEYASAVDSLALNRDDLVFANKDFKHAAIVIATILKYSKEEVLIYEDNLLGRISDNEDYISINKSIEDFLVRGGKLRMVLTEKTDALSRLGRELQFYAKNFKEDVKVKFASDAFKKAVVHKNSEVFFVLGDKRMLRKENVQFEDKFTRKGEAVGCFNAPKTSEKLFNLFTTEFDSCQDYFQGITIS